MKCKICNSLCNLIFNKKILLKYDADFFQCSNCGFLQTEHPYWLGEAYKLPFTPLDVYLASRPIELGQVTENLIFNYFNYNGKFLDYGGGIGLFTRIMRDRGFNFYRQDKYAQNLFTQFFDISDLPTDERNFEMVTAFEVVEHLVNPLDELDEMFSLSKNVFISTMIQPSSVQELESWFYIAELHGQHISFFTKEAMQIVAAKFNCNYYSSQDGFLHLFTPLEISNFNTLKSNQDRSNLSLRVKNKLIYLIEKIHEKLFVESQQMKIPTLESLTTKDSEWIIQKLQKQEIMK